MVESSLKLEPIYDVDTPNQDIRISTEKAKINTGKNQFEVEADVVLKLLPKPRIEINSTLSGQYWVPIGGGSWTVLLIERNLSTEVLPINANMSISNGESTVSVTMLPKIQHIVSLEPQKYKIRKVVFHVVNFLDYDGERIIADLEKGHRIALDQVRLEAENWNITIVSTINTRDKIKSLKGTGGYAITHVGQIERQRGEAFSQKDAEGLIVALYYFLSMARGFWTDIILPVGFDNSGNRIWEEWGVRRTDEWQNVLSWFDGSKASLLLPEIFPSFLRFWENNMWRDVIARSIYWYMAANKSGMGIDIGIVLAQAALEVLAWNYAVKEKCLVSEEGFKNLRASDQFRILLRSLDIPLEIPVHLKNLNKLAKKYRWLDGAQVISEIRNNIVHPKRRFEFEPKNAIREAWNLGLWYVELVLLRLFDYKGEYSNRLSPNKWRGQLETIP